jgi:hypothetical protein
MQTVFIKVRIGTVIDCYEYGKDRSGSRKKITNVLTD